MTASRIAILDYGAGNLKSVVNALTLMGADHFLASSPSQLADASALIFPGDGEAAACMEVLRRTGLDEALRGFLASGRKMMGICIGCQVVFDGSEERDAECMGLFPGRVRRFPPATLGLKVPHMGWNTAHFLVDHPVFAGVPQDSCFYFVHSYYPAPSNPGMAAAMTEYGIDFPSCVAAGGFIAFQFHPEKSGPAGLKLLSNFLAWNGEWGGLGADERAAGGRRA